jgi:hypothetical protein
MTTALERVVEAHEARTAAAPPMAPPAVQPVAPMAPQPDNAAAMADLQAAVSDLNDRMGALEAAAVDDAMAEMDVSPMPMMAAAAKVTKSEGDAGDFPAGDYAYLGKPDQPSTWKLRLTASPGGAPDAGLVGAAAAALSPAGYRGNRVDISAADRARVVAKVRAAWHKASPDKPDSAMPDSIKP